jgi:uncharacterized protein
MMRAVATRAPGWTLSAVVAVLVAVNLLNNRLLPGAYLPTCLAAAALLLAVARRDGCSWSDLGLGATAVRSGLWWSAVLVGLVLVGLAVAAAVPVARPAFVDDRAAGLSGTVMLWRALVRIPLGTALLEEVAFRGVLAAMLTRRHGVRAAVVVSSLLFGLWHVLPSLGLRTATPPSGACSGPGRRGPSWRWWPPSRGPRPPGWCSASSAGARAACSRRSRCTGRSTAAGSPSPGR